MADAKANLESVTGRVDATESEITKAQTRLTNAETAVKKAQTDATTAQTNAQTAINNAKTAQTTADTAKANAEQAQKDLNALTNRVTKTETAIKQNADAIKLQATKITDTGKKIDDLKIGGRNLIKYGKGDSKNGIFKNSTRIEDGYAEFTLKSKQTYATVNIGEGFVLGCREYKVGAVYIWSYDIMFTEWNFPSGTNRNEFWFGQRYINAPSGQTGTGQWTKVTAHNLPEVGSNGCKLNEWYHVEQKIIIPAQASANVGTSASIQFYNSNANIEASFTARLKNVKLELGNKATDWTPAPEDVDNSINTERTERQSAIETKANEITSKVSETYVSNSAFEHYQNTVSTQFTQTKKDFTWSINQSVTDAKNEMSGQIDSVNGRLDGLKQTTDNVNSYMSFDNDALTLGKSDSAFKTKITNQEWSIQKNGAKVTYINDQTMYITDGQFTQSLKVGAFGFVPRANGSLDFKKVG